MLIPSLALTNDLELLIVQLSINKVLILVDISYLHLFED